MNTDTIKTCGRHAISLGLPLVVLAGFAFALDYSGAVNPPVDQTPLTLELEIYLPMAVAMFVLLVAFIMAALPYLPGMARVGR